MRFALVLLVLGALVGGGAYTAFRSVVLPRLVGVVVARDGRIEELVSGQGFVIRHETVLRSPVAGTLTLALGEAERARSGAEVANLSDTEEKREAGGRVARLETDLVAFNGSHAAEETALIEELSSALSEARSHADSLRVACLENDFDRIESLTAELAADGKRQAEAADRLRVIREERTDLAKALAAARAALDQVVFPIVAPQVGIISYCLDGLEETLTPDKIGRYRTTEVLAMERRKTVTSDQARVRAGDSVAKVIADEEAFVSVIVANSEADQLAQVKHVTLRFPDFEGRRETPANLFHVGEREKNGYCLVTYVTQEFLDGMVSARQVGATVVVRAYAGTVLPRKAVVRRGGEDGVFVLDTTVARFQPVTVKGGNDTEVVVEGLVPGTPVISTPWFVREGMRIGTGREGGDGDGRA